jgi:hypothetical protein
VNGDFEDFWSVYPNKVGKPAALKAFIRAKPDQSALLLGLDRWRHSDGWPLRWEDAICNIIGTDKAGNHGKSFGWMLTRAWLDGLIPADFDRKAMEFFAGSAQRKALYLNAVQTHGATAVHEGRVIAG